MPGLGTSFGRGGATDHQQALQHSDCILIMGSNMAEQHPVGFQWVIEAKERGATVIHVDPRFTRTSAMADIHVPLRGGSEWEDLSLEQATDMIADRVIAARRETWEEETDDGRPLKRTLGVAFLGGATLDSEENYLIKKFFTAAGAVSIENQARI